MTLCPPRAPIPAKSFLIPQSLFEVASLTDYDHGIGTSQ